MTRNRYGYEDITKIVPNGVNSLELLTKALIQYSLNLGPKKIPKELFPHGFNQDNSIKVTDGSKNLQKTD